MVRIKLFVYLHRIIKHFIMQKQITHLRLNILSEELQLLILKNKNFDIKLSDKLTLCNSIRDLVNNYKLD